MTEYDTGVREWTNQLVLIRIPFQPNDDNANPLQITMYCRDHDYEESYVANSNDAIPRVPELFVVVALTLLWVDAPTPTPTPTPEPNPDEESTPDPDPIPPGECFGINYWPTVFWVEPTPGWYAFELPQGSAGPFRYLPQLERIHITSPRANTGISRTTLGYDTVIRNNYQSYDNVMKTIFQYLRN